MSYDPPRPVGRLLLTPEDREAPARTVRLRQLGLGERPEPALDAFAVGLAERAGAPYAMVNFVAEHGQFLAGLHCPHPGSLPGRSLPREVGFCPHVVVRRRALALEDVRDYPRFATNPIVDEYGIRSYLGAPLADSTGMVLGTVCVADAVPRRWGRDGLETIKAVAAQLARHLEGTAGAFW
ncbi:GAF domain-containing protein [Streptomyces echinoruber]|uniref:Histidine kinase n=1 Tax=Streptomyces echinoruber TaxID=68898 RepID=A0A918RQ46_9ACTN|nr:GAF domain-containing protein [Streptomyces echinoruber]GHA07892.1 histidine kinase [Streptomyces echinoruber]